MIRASFKSDNTYFGLKGHSGYAEAGSDIVCAAVSSMASLVIHVAVDIYKDGGEVFQDEKTAELKFYPKKPESYALVEGLYNQLASLAEEYPEYISVKSV